MVLNKQQQELAEKNHDLIYWYTNKRGLDLDEYYGDLAIALCRAAYHYDESSGASFSTYAVASMDNTVKKMIQKKARTIEATENILTTEWEYENYDDEPFTLGDMIQDPNVDLEGYVVTNILVEEFVKSLSERYRFILKSLLSGKTQAEIGHELGVSRQCVNQILLRIRSAWREVAC